MTWINPAPLVCLQCGKDLGDKCDRPSVYYVVTGDVMKKAYDESKCDIHYRSLGDGFWECHPPCEPTGDTTVLDLTVDALRKAVDATKVMYSNGREPK